MIFIEDLTKYVILILSLVNSIIGHIFDLTLRIPYVRALITILKISLKH
jgi:hypothetical protein